MYTKNHKKDKMILYLEADVEKYAGDVRVKPGISYSTPDMAVKANELHELGFFQKMNDLKYAVKKKNQNCKLHYLR